MVFDDWIDSENLHKTMNELAMLVDHFYNETDRNAVAEGVFNSSVDKDLWFIYKMGFEKVISVSLAKDTESGYIYIKYNY